MCPLRWLAHPFVTLRTSLLALSIVSALPVLLNAQSPDGRRQLSALRDSVFQIAMASDASILARAEQASLGRDKSDALLLMQAGLAQLRLGQLSPDRAPLDRAQALFDEAVYRAPDDWPWPWYGLALADLALDSAGVVVKPSMHSGAGMYYRRAGIRALTRSLEADSSFAPAAALLASLIIPEADQDLDGDVQRAIRRAATQPGATAAQLALGRIQRNLGHPDSSLQAFRLYVANGGDSAVGLLESARMLNALDSVTAASSTYFAGATAANDSVGLTAYRTDIAWVASDAEIAAFDSLPPDSIQPWLQRFWAKRDARELRAPGERLAEHFRRWRYVYQKFQVVGRREGAAFASPDPRFGCSADGGVPAVLTDATAGQLAASSHGHRIVDDRGIIYMRHGAPDQLAFHGPCLAWAFQTTTGRLILQFGPSTLLGVQAPTTLVEMFPLSDTLYGAMMGLDASYAVIAGELRENEMNEHWRKLGQRMTASGGTMGSVTSASSNIISRIAVEHMRRERQQDMRIGLTTDGFPPHFKHQLSPQAQFYAVGSPGRVLVVFALAGDEIQGQALPDGGTGYPVMLRLIATNAQGQVMRVDTTRRFRSAKALRKGDYLFGLEELRLAPGTWDVRLLVSEPGTGVGGAIGRIGVTVPGSTALALSDLVLGREGSGLRWQSPAGTVSLNPLDSYPRQGTAELYYELSGATPGATYRTDIEVKGINGDAKGTVHLTFNEPGRTSLVRARRSIGLDKLETGQYRITVTVTEQGTGRTAVQTRLLNVAE